MKIGVFDSGVGGLSVANAIKRALPDCEVVLKEDKENVPYGSKDTEHVYRLALPLLKELEEEGCGVIVIACNTVTTTLINRLREDIGVPLIGIEPMVKPASKLTKNMVIAVCATPATLASPRYKFLKEKYAESVKVLEPDCSDWSHMIEHSKIDRAVIEERINSVLDQGADVIVLACTHYHWIEREISELAKGRAIVLQPEEAVIKKLGLTIEQLT